MNKNSFLVAVILTLLAYTFLASCSQPPTSTTSSSSAEQNVASTNPISTSRPKQESSIVGKWERVGDHLAGMTVEVMKAEGNFRSKITDMPKDTGSYGFEVGQLKWKDIELVSENQWEGLDSISNLVTVTYSNASFTIYNDGKLLRVEAMNQDQQNMAKIQKWRRVE